MISSWLSHCRALGRDVRKMENNKQAPNANTNDSLPSPLKKTKTITIHNVFYFPNVI